MELYEYTFTPPAVAALLQVHTTSSGTDSHLRGAPASSELCDTLIAHWPLHSLTSPATVSSCSVRGVLQPLGHPAPFTVLDVEWGGEHHYVHAGAWWIRVWVRQYLPPLERDNVSLQKAMQSLQWAI